MNDKCEMKNMIFELIKFDWINNREEITSNFYCKYLIIDIFCT
jgi:hypothetical protein